MSDSPATEEKNNVTAAQPDAPKSPPDDNASAAVEPKTPEASASPEKVTTLPETPPELPAVNAPGLKVRIAGNTDVGRIREHNEDNLLVADLTTATRGIEGSTSLAIGARGLVFSVCDGMGGAAAGEIASQMAVDIIHGIVQDEPAPHNSDQFAQKLVASIQEAGARIYLAAKSNRSQRGMGTTSTAAGIFDTTVFVGQVGDSRAYLVRAGRIRQITKDQSLVSKLIQAGSLSEAEAETYEHSHIILQALGTADTVSVDLSFVDLRKGDALLLCSDGLSGLITSEQMRDTIVSIDDPFACCQQLIDLANESGGHDNVTVILTRVDDGAPEPEPEDEQIGYQPYVLAVPAEILVVGRASSSMKQPELPPPGIDVKHTPSLPPEAPKPKESPSTNPPVHNEELKVPVDPGSGALTWVFAAIAAAALLLGGYYFTHQKSGVEDATPDASAPAQSDGG